MQIESLGMRGAMEREGRLSDSSRGMLLLQILKPLSLGSQTHMPMGTRKMNAMY